MLCFMTMAQGGKVPNLELIGGGLKAGAEAVREIARSFSRSVSDEMPEIFGGYGRLDERIFQRALELAADTNAQRQLAEMQAAADRLKNSRVESVIPVRYVFSEPLRADLLSADGTKTSGYLHILDEESFSVSSPRVRKNVPAQLISANLFGTVPNSALRKLSFSPEMLANRGLMSSRKEFWEHRELLEKRNSLRQFHIERSVWEGKPVNVIVSDDAGKSLDDLFACGWGPCPELIRRSENNPDLHRALQKTIVDREVIGDTDPNGDNLTFRNEPTEPVIGNIDLERAFQKERWPALRLVFRDEYFSGQRLDSAIVSRIGSFVDAYGQAQGRQLMQDLLMEPKEIEGVLARAQWFADHKRLPAIAEEHFGMLSSPMLRSFKSIFTAWRLNKTG